MIIDLDEEASEIIIGGTISMTANTVSIECYSREEAEKLFDSFERYQIIRKEAVVLPKWCIYAWIATLLFLLTLAVAIPLIQHPPQI